MEKEIKICRCETRQVRSLHYVVILLVYGPNFAHISENTDTSFSSSSFFFFF